MKGSRLLAGLVLWLFPVVVVLLIALLVGLAVVASTLVGNTAPARLILQLAAIPLAIAVFLAARDALRFLAGGDTAEATKVMRRAAFLDGVRARASALWRWFLQRVRPPVRDRGRPCLPRGGTARGRAVRAGCRAAHRSSPSAPCTAPTWPGGSRWRTTCPCSTCPGVVPPSAMPSRT